MSDDPTVLHYYSTVTPENIKLVHDKHVCNPNPNFNAEGYYTGDFTELSGKDGMKYFGLNLNGGMYEPEPSASPTDRYYLGSRMPKVNAYQGNNAYLGLRQSNAITGVFGGPDADLVKPHVEGETVYDVHGGTPTYWPEGLVESANGISLGSFINHGGYVPTWGGRTHTGTGTVVQRGDNHSNNKFVRNGQHPYGYAYEGIPHTVTSATPSSPGYSGHPGSPAHDHMGGDGGISFGQFAHSSPDVPEITQSFPNSGFGDSQALWDTQFERRTNTSISSTILNPAMVMVEYKTDANAATKSYTGAEDGKYGDSPDFGRYIEVNLYTQDGNGNGHADAGASFEPVFTKEDTHRIKWKNFELDDVTFKINTYIETLQFQGSSQSAISAQGVTTPYFVLEYRFFDAFEGVWSDFRRENISEADYKATRLNHHLPFGFYCPMLEANDNRYRVSGLQFINMFGYYKGGTSSNWSPLRTGQITQNFNTDGDRSLASRTFMITCLQVRVGVGGTGGATAGNYVEIGSGASSYDRFESEIVIDFPYTPSEQLHGLAFNQMVPGNDPVEFDNFPNNDHATLSGFLDENDPQYIFSGSWDDSQDNSTGPNYINSLYKQKWQRKRLNPEGARKAASVPRNDIDTTLGGDSGAGGFWSQGLNKVTAGYAFPIGSETVKSYPRTLGKYYKLKARWY